MSIGTKRNQSDIMSGSRTAQCIRPILHNKTQCADAGSTSPQSHRIRQVWHFWNTHSGVWICVEDGIGDKKTHSSLDISAVSALIPQDKKCTHCFYNFKHCQASFTLISDSCVWAEKRSFLRNTHTHALGVTAAFARLTTALGHPCPRGLVWGVTQTDR